DGGEDPKKAAIAAALKRAAEKKAALAESGVTPKNQEDLTEGQKRAIKQVNERRAVHEKDTTTSEEQGE
ncbi:MAG: electron transport complex subunit RsxB, partial [Sedimenticola sp.]|nr:electron transport complex subunit RsxB [Sedimenticola sp.]